MARFERAERGVDRSDVAHTRALPALALLVACLLPLPGLAGKIYSYVDENGVTHFSNVPTDPRYERVVLSTRFADEAPRRVAPSNVGYDGLILLNARAHDVPPALVKAVIAAESAFDAYAVSHAGAQGLMQLMPRTAAALGVKDPFQPEDNVSGGTRYLRQMIDRYGKWTHALAAYNAGPDAVDRYRGVPPYQETRDYVRRVLDYYRRYDGDFGH